MDGAERPTRSSRPSMPTIEKPTVRRGWVGSSASDGEPLRIVLAEDDREMRWMLAGVLRRDGHEVIEASDGLELVAALTSVAGIDLVVSDLRMPGVDGLEALRRLRLAGVETPMLLMTAFPDQHLYEEAVRNGAVGVLDKPFDIGDFRTIALVVGRRPPGGRAP